MGYHQMPDLETLAGELPDPLQRWTARRKAAVVAAITLQRISREEACRRYQVTEEELTDWIARLEQHGVRGLRTTRLQQFRPVAKADLA
jgi:transposase-like protein